MLIIWDLTLTMPYSRESANHGHRSFLFLLIKFLSEQWHSFIYIFSVTALCYRGKAELRVIMIDTIWPTDPKIFTIWPFAGKVCQYQPWSLETKFCIFTVLKSHRSLCIDFSSTDESFACDTNLAQVPNNFHDANYENSARVWKTYNG